MEKNIFVIIVVLIFRVNTSSKSKSRPQTELYDAFNRFVHFSPTLFGQHFTEQDEELYDAGSKLQGVQLEIEEIISKDGYPVETYEVTSEDGYILRVFRIRGGGMPVFLMHGLMLSADDWVTPGPEVGLAYFFAAEGYDVWMGNARGTKHSRHTTLPPHSAAFWDFSWDEIGRYDLPAMIDLVLRVTNHTRLLFVGHSQGTTAFFVMASERPDYNDKVSLMVALAPVTAIPNIKSPILQFINYATLMYPNKLFAALRRYGLNELAQRNAITEAFSLAACVDSKIARALCSSLVFVMCGFNYSQLNFTTLPVVLSHLSTSEVSFKQIEHYAQTITSQMFARFDHGEKKNKALYGSRVPPEYNVSAVTTPVALFHGPDDWLAAELDTRVLSTKLTNVVEFYKVRDMTFKHMDFVYAKDVRKLVFIPMLKQIKKYLL